MSVIQEIFEESRVGTHDMARSVMTLPDGKWANVSLKMFFSVCENAACPCTEMTIGLVPEDKAESQPQNSELAFKVDLREKKLVSHNEADVNNIKKEIIDHFDDQDWHKLWQVFSNIKMEHTENLTIENTRADFPMEKAIETHCELVPYSEILPYGRKFYLQNAEGTILIEEHYCLKRGCNCDLVSISIFNLDSDQQVVGKEARLDVGYKNGKVNSVENGSFKQSPRQLLKTFLETYPDLFKQFSKRHQQLTELYRQYRKSKSQTKTRTQPKIGRNDPCLCGSGKKFKKCCMN